jgi:hypothetical protein
MEDVGKLDLSELFIEEFVGLSPDPVATQRVIDQAKKVIKLPHLAGGIFQIADNLVELVPIVRALDSEAYQRVSPLETLAAHIQSIRGDHPWAMDDRLHRGKREVGTGNSRVIPPLRFMVTPYPAWVSLWFRSGDSALQKTYMALQAAYLISVSGYDPENCIFSMARMDKYISQAGAFIRSVHAVEHCDELVFFDGHTDTIDNIHQRLTNYRHAIAGEDFGLYRAGYLADLMYIILGVGEDLVVRLRGQSSYSYYRPSGHRQQLSIGKQHSLWQDYDQFSGALDTDNNTRSVVVKLEPGKHLQEVLHGNGVDPVEYGEVVEGSFSPVELGMLDESILDDLETGKIDRSKLLSKIKSVPPMSTLFAASSAKMRHIIVDNQRLTTRLRRPVIPDLVKIFQVLDDAFQDADEYQQELVALTTVTILLGTPPKDLIKLSDVTSVDDLPEKYRIAYSSRYRVWIRPYQAPERNKLAESIAGNSVEVLPRVILGDYFDLYKLLGKSTDGHWFNRTLPTYEKIFKQFLLPRLEVAGCDSVRFTMNSLSLLIPDYLIGKEEGDYLRVAVLFGRGDPLSSTHRYYTVLNRERLEKHYRCEMIQLRNRLVQNGYERPGGVVQWRQGTGKKVPKSLAGDSWVPKVTTVKKLIEELQLRLRFLFVDPNSLGDIVARHNLLTTYVALVLALVTGFRSVRTPIVDLDMVDFNGFLSLHEKDRRDGAHARIVYLPLPVQQMVKTYLKHLRRFILRQPIQFSGVIDVVASKARDRMRADRSQLDMSRYDLLLSRTFFYVHHSEDGLSYQELTGNNLSERINHYCPDSWPVSNAGRHFLRSWLTNTGCDATVINTQMGHWSRGEESWADFSATDPCHFRSEISKHLDQLLSAISFDSATIHLAVR